MSRVLFDSVTPERLPSNATMVACYRDGRYANEAAVRARCTKAQIVTITVRGHSDANVIDCETGDATPEQAAQWASDQITAGRRPTIYCNLSTWDEVKKHVAAHHLSTISYWVAHYDGIAEVPPNAVAKQYQERTDQNLDYSAVANYWPGVDAELHTPPTPLEKKMWLIRRKGGAGVYVTDWISRRGIATNAELQAIIASGVPARIFEVSQDVFDRIKAA